MSLPCVYYDPTEPCPCAVLRDAGCGLAPEGVMEGLAERYCSEGIPTCPIFLRVQRRRKPKSQDRSGVFEKFTSWQDRHCEPRRKNGSELA